MMSLRETNDDVKKPVEEATTKQEKPQEKAADKKEKEYTVNIPEGHVLNVRSEAKIDNQNIVGTLKPGDKIKGFGTEGEFTIVKFKGKPAYVMSSKLS